MVIEKNHLESCANINSGTIVLNIYRFFSILINDTNLIQLPISSQNVFSG
jgi:hypothetical protein